MSIQTASKERAAARRDCQAGTLSPDFESKHGFIIRLFFWVILPAPWLHWIKIKAQSFMRLSWRKVLPVLCSEKSTQMKGCVRRSRAAAREGTDTGQTDTQLRPFATTHAEETCQGTAMEGSEARRARPRADFVVTFRAAMTAPSRLASGWSGIPRSCSRAWRSHLTRRGVRRGEQGTQGALPGRMRQAETAGTTASSSL